MKKLTNCTPRLGGGFSEVVEVILCTFLSLEIYVKAFKSMNHRWLYIYFEKNLSLRSVQFELFLSNSFQTFFMLLPGPPPFFVKRGNFPLTGDPPL